MSRVIELHWFRFSSDKDGLYPDLSLLSPEEVKQFDGFENRQAASDFALRRSFRRRVLGDQLNIPPGQLRFKSNDAGKPALIAGQNAVRFNTSHGRYGGVLALCEAFPVGVDIEFFRPIDEAAFAEKILSPRERATHFALQAEVQLASLFAIWTAKEAVIKALGIGLNLNQLPLIDVDPQERHSSWRDVRISPPLPQADWKIWTQRLDDAFGVPAIVSIAAPEACEVVIREAD